MIEIYYCPARGKAIEKVKPSPRRISLGPVVLNAAARSFNPIFVI